MLTPAAATSSLAHMSYTCSLVHMSYMCSLSHMSYTCSLAHMPYTCSLAHMSCMCHIGKHVTRHNNAQFGGGVTPAAATSSLACTAVLAVTCAAPTAAVCICSTQVEFPAASADSPPPPLIERSLGFRLTQNPKPAPTLRQPLPLIDQVFK